MADTIYMEIKEGKKEDAAFLAKVVTEAVGPELCEGLAKGKQNIPRVMELFTTLASRKDSQYSHNNAFIAISDAGLPLGGIIAYDGARLQGLRRAFFQEANRILGWNVTEKEADNWENEADAGEIYIDSLFVVPEARGKGVASALLKAVEEKYTDSGKPLGLLVDPENTRALRTYRHWGFRNAGLSNFFATPMIHLQRESSFKPTIK